MSRSSAERTFALQAAQFDSFYPRFVEALNAASRGQSGTWEAAKFLADSHFKFFAAFAKGLLAVSCLARLQR